MSKGFARPYLILAVLVIIGAGVAVFAGSHDLTGFVLGAKSRKENIYQNKADGLKVTVISQKSSWDLVQYLCKTREECESSITSGKWWATVGGAPTTEDGHEIFIEKSDDWVDYGFIKVAVKEAGLGSNYLSTDSGDSYYLYNLSAIESTDPATPVIFR